MNLVAGSRNSTNSTANSSEDKSQAHHAARGKVEPALSRSLSGLADEDVSTSPDLQRALDLVDLHYGVKQKYMQEGGKASLEHARREVARVTSEIQ